MSDPNYASFEELNLGTVQPTSVPSEVVEVQVGLDSLIGDYGKAFVNEAYRVNPLKAEQVQLTAEEMVNYANFLLDRRIKTVNLDCPDFRKLKALYIPSYLQYAISMIGRVDIRDKGLIMMPVLAPKTKIISFEEAVAISEKIGSFEHDLQIVQNAMPRDIHGNKDVMSSAMVAGYIRALEKVEHVSSTYLAAFLGMQLKKEMAFQILYRVQYDDVAFIASVLTTQKGLF